jgi:hypothetical protein
MLSVTKMISFIFCLTILSSCGEKSKSPSAQKNNSDQKDHANGIKNPQLQDSFSPSQPSTPPIMGSAVEEIPIDMGALSNLEALKKRFNLSTYYTHGYHGQRLKVGIFDNGFAGLKHSLGKRLPPNLKVEKSFDPRMQPSSHGTKMAEIVYALTSGQNSYANNQSAPEIFLFNTNGFTNLQTAIDRALELKIDLVLYAQVWEFGGQFDGDGFINSEINRALKGGIVWINASGNGGASTYSGPINSKIGRWIEFKERNDRLQFIVPQDDTPTKVVLSWSDFKDSKNYKTNVDLDLIIEDSQGNLIQESRMSQTGSNESTPGFSAHARESIEVTLKRGTYSVGVYYKSNSQLKEDSVDERNRFRVTAVGSGITMPEGTPYDSLPIPADNQGVLAVGASDTDYSGRLKPLSSDQPLREKPDLWLESEVVFTDPNESNPLFQTQTHYGTSAASALATGVMAVYMSAWGKLSLEEILTICKDNVINCKTMSLPDLP